MIYARVHDDVVADDYYKAMEVVENRLDHFDTNQKSIDHINDCERRQLLSMVNHLAQPELSSRARDETLANMLRILTMVSL